MLKTPVIAGIYIWLAVPLSPQKLNATKFGSIFYLKKILWQNRGNLIFIFENSLVKACNRGGSIPFLSAN
uniref:hypothetical protein n=1 Tax=uncultured Flavobacterium sp. TaxID=165435 RepID=UPI0027DFA0C0